MASCKIFKVPAGHTGLSLQKCCTLLDFLIKCVLLWFRKPLLLQTTGILFVIHPRDTRAKMECTQMKKGIPNQTCRLSITYAVQRKHYKSCSSSSPCNTGRLRGRAQLVAAAKLTAAATPPRWDPRAGESQVIPSQLNPAPAIAPHMVFSFWEMQAEGRQDGRDPTSLHTFPEMRSDFFPPHTLIFMPPPLNTV